MGDALRITARDGGVRFAVHVQPRASANEIAGRHGDAIKVRLTAAPADGAANVALITLLAERFAIPARSVRLVSGAHARAKVIEVDGIAVDDVRRLLTTSGDD